MILLTDIYCSCFYPQICLSSDPRNFREKNSKLHYLCNQSCSWHHNDLLIENKFMVSFIGFLRPSKTQGVMPGYPTLHKCRSTEIPDTYNLCNLNSTNRSSYAQRFMNGSSQHLGYALTFHCYTINLLEPSIRQSMIKYS